MERLKKVIAAVIWVGLCIVLLALTVGLWDEVVLIARTVRKDVIGPVLKSLSTERYQDQEFAFAFFWLGIVPAVLVLVVGLWALMTWHEESARRREWRKATKPPEEA